MVEADELPDGVVVADASGTVVEVNRAAVRLLGAAAGDLLGRPVAEALPFRDPAGRDWWADIRPYDGLAIRSGTPERLLACRDHMLQVTTRFVRKGQCGPVARLVVALRDAAARERQERGRAELVSVVSHELRSPLTSVKGFTATLLAKWDRFTDEQKKVMLETVNADADRVTRLIGELLDVSRIDAGRLQLHRQVVDVERVVRRVVEGQIAAGEEPERFAVTVVGDLPELWGDQDKLTQVVVNLVENAVRHGAGRVGIRIRPAGDGVAVEVSDEGPGVDPQVVPHLFTKFWKSGPRGGSGLGLFVSRGLVEAHGGTIRAGAADGGGACFTVTVPSGKPEFA